jgi:hypothetical protein
LLHVGIAVLIARPKVWTARRVCCRRYAINVVDAEDELPHVPAPADGGQ